jgi:uncharacterized protein (TIGR03437 family)
MKSGFLATLAVLGLTTAATGQNVRVTWVGQSCFIVQSENGPVVLTDPPAASVGYSIPNIPADAVTVTHNHADHNNTAGVKGNFQIVDGRPVNTRTQMTAANLPFVLIPGFHDGQNGAATGPNTIIQWTQSGLRFAQFGDMGQDALTEVQLADLQNLDVLFFPAGGYFTVDPDQAAAMVAQIGARVTILEHYRTALAGPATAAALPAAAAAFANVVYKPSSIVISQSSLPASKQVWVMEPLSDTVVVNSGGYTGGAVAAGSLATIFGSFTGADTMAAPQFPLPVQLGQTRVLIQGNAVPLSYVSPRQVNMQIPAGVSVGQYIVSVQVAGQEVARAPLTVALRAPGLFTVRNADGLPNSPSNPAHAGDTIQILGTGQGPNPGTTGVADGAAAPLSPAALTRGLPAVTIGGTRATVRSSVLEPGSAGVWQVSVTVPALTAGSAVPVIVAYGSLSGSVSAAIQ